MNMNRSTLWALLSLFSALLASLAMLIPFSLPLRPLITFWFLLFCPGLAVISFFHFQDGLTELVLALAFSIALDTLVALTMVEARIWSPFWGITLIVTLSVLAASAQLWRSWRSGSHEHVIQKEAS